MKGSFCLSLLACLFFACQVEKATPAALDDQIIAFLEELRVRMCHPFPKYGIPALDPLSIEHLEVEADNQYFVDFSASITDFKLTGLSDFIINDLQIKKNPLSKSVINVTMPFTALNSLYTAKGSLAYILNLAGEGKAHANADKVTVYMSWYLKTSLKLGIRNFVLRIQINGIFMDFENLFEEERINDFIHDLVNELGLELMDDVWKVENGPAEKYLENLINNYIGQYTLADIIKIITGGGGEGGPIFGDIPGDCKDEMQIQKKTELQ